MSQLQWSPEKCPKPCSALCIKLPHHRLQCFLPLQEEPVLQEHTFSHQSNPCSWRDYLKMPTFRAEWILYCHRASLCTLTPHPRMSPFKLNGNLDWVELIHPRLERPLMWHIRTICYRTLRRPRKITWLPPNTSSYFPDGNRNPLVGFYLTPHPIPQRKHGRSAEVDISFSCEILTSPLLRK